MSFAFSVWLIFSKNFQAQKKKYEGKQTTGLRTKHNYPSSLYFCFQLPAFIEQQDSCLHLNNIYEKINQVIFRSFFYISGKQNNVLKLALTRFSINLFTIPEHCLFSLPTHTTGCLLSIIFFSYILYLSLQITHWLSVKSLLETATLYPGPST